MSIVFLFNPASGAQRRQPLDLRGLVKRVLPIGTEVHIRQTRYAGHATELAAEAAVQGARVVVAVGGDGTVNEVAAGLLGTEAALGIVPRGSGNGLARHLRIPLDPAAALRHLVKGYRTTIDAGRINGRPFFCTAGVGFDGHISREFAKSEERGLLTYAKLLFSEFGRYKPTSGTLFYDEAAGLAPHELRELFVLTFANAAQYGNNAYIAPMADIRDGTLDACVLRHPTFWGAMGIAAGMMTSSLPRFGATYFRTTQARVALYSPLPFHADGEYVGAAADFTIEVLPGALHVVAI
ncbi:MAG: diacylglycerol kinase family lipid kinase [Hymenobacteraceae bacterium]|nr:diacylglycerol kinase family lipid kinase [Hymenobacteraceae bacterium]